MFTIPLNTNTSESLYEQIYNYIKQEILDGHIKAGDKLPSTRTLAANLSVSRNTVDIAYEQLLCEGYIDSYERKGYFVSQIQYNQDFSHPIENTTDPQLKTPSQYDYDFSPDNVDMTPFPHSIWRRLSKEQMNDTSLFSLGDSQGDYSFRSAIANYLHGSRGVTCNASQVIIGAGVDYLLLILTSILDSHRTIAIENPAYQRARHVFSSSNFPITDIDVTESGINLSQLEQSGASYCYVTPSHQFPLGSIMPISNRQRLITWAKKDSNRYIIEDDHDSEFRYKGKPIPSLQGLDNSGKVIYIGTLSKAIAPAIRIGYMVLPESLLALYKEKCSYLACTVSRIDQALLSSFITEGYFEKHLNRMRKIYKNKHDLVISMLKEQNITIRGGNAGLYLVLYLNKKGGKTLEDDIIALAKENRIKLYGLYEYYTKEPSPYRPGVLLGFGCLSEESLINGIKVLCEKVLP